MVRGSPIAGEPSPYAILFEPRASREYDRIVEAGLLARVNREIDRLSREPRHAGAVRLAGRDDYRVRVGDWRIVYEVDDAQRRVIVARIAHRSDVYRRRR